MLDEPERDGAGLCSDAAHFVAGYTMVVDGGMSVL